ncbi:hypothetical protein [Intrasporangium sp. DVR]|uniref:hypothetical protein n=1 Tax=Intrasporangium sp. DVR TaxID=3127867 RepID=UPI00313A6D0E
MSTQFPGPQQEQQAQDEQAQDEQAQDEQAQDEQAAGALEVTVPAAATPRTGDEVIDAVLADVAAAQAGSLTERISAGERAQAALRSRLSDLGGA